MLPKMLAVQAEDSGMFYDFEADQFLATEVSEPELPSTSSGDNHDSDCATHNEPAYPNGPCDCTLAKSHPSGITIKRRF